mgnify:CR=1 FL=1
MSDAVLSLENIQTYYGKIHALRGINITVHQGQVVTLLGSNGAGKSTTLKTISGLVHAASGKVIFMGKDITREQPHVIVEMGVIHVPEGRRIFKDLTVRENLELGSYTLKDEKERRRRIDRVFERFPRLEERHKQIGGTLSGGEQQMLAIGRALMIEPKVLLMDEPSMGLAPVIVQEIARIIRQLNDEGTTILLVEQNSKMALKLADYGYVMDTGKIVLEDDSKKLREDESIIKAYLGG